MKVFDFSNTVVRQVINELGRAEEYINIAIFQIHNDLVIDKLLEKARGGVRIEIITLPYDSINEEIREHVTGRLEELKAAGTNILFCRWNVGDPERTTTAVGRWYSFHGKFIVTDKAAISLSANFIQSSELDAILIFKGEPDKIQEFNDKFKELKELFITGKNGYEGSIRQKILDTNNPRIRGVFDLPRVIPPGVHDKTWIQHYPPELCPEEVDVDERLYFTPFDCRGRYFFMKIISDAERFVYISSESFTDKEFPNFLKKIKLKNNEMKVLTGYKSMDFTDRIKIFMKELLAAGIELKTTTGDLHAKLIITEKLVALSSINLNNINLGFPKAAGFWRENTETILVCKDSSLIREARQKYNSIFNASENMIDKIAEKDSVAAGKLFMKVFNVRSSSDAKLFLAKLNLRADVNKEKFILDVLKLAIKAADNFSVGVITKREILMALILNYLSERKHTPSELLERLNQIIEGGNNVSPILEMLLENGLIVRHDSFYKINVDAIL